MGTTQLLQCCLESTGAATAVHSFRGCSENHGVPAVEVALRRRQGLALKFSFYLVLDSRHSGSRASLNLTRSPQSALAALLRAGRRFLPSAFEQEV